VSWLSAKGLVWLLKRDIFAINVPKRCLGIISTRTGHFYYVKSHLTVRSEMFRDLSRSAGKVELSNTENAKFVRSLPLDFPP
jgi:hypothetical protein